jgi:hypothetical protein
MTESSQGKPTSSPDEEPSVLRESADFGDQLDWSSEMVEVTLVVELPFWLMIDDCDLKLLVDSALVKLSLRDRYVQLYAGPVLNSAQTLVWQGPENERPALTPAVVAALEQQGAATRLCRSVVRLMAYAHSDVFAALAEKNSETELPRRANEAQIYVATLCDAHIPVLNDLIQRYRLATYDYFPHEVTPWDVPVWMVVTPHGSTMVRLLAYSEWDRKPIIHDQDKTGQPEAEASSFRFTDPPTVSATDPSQATPGEFDILDARSLMERGDYTGAIRRSVTAVEAVVEHALRNELLNRFSTAEVERKLEASQNDYPGRYRQWKKLSQVNISGQLEADFSATRTMRHQIVHRALRLTPSERGKAQRSVDTARWLFNAIENKVARAALREESHVLREVGRVAHSPRFETVVDGARIRVIKAL